MQKVIVKYNICIQLAIQKIVSKIEISNFIYSLQNHCIYAHFIQISIANIMLPRYMYYSLWRLLQARYSQLASVCVPLLLHCLVLPTGPDMLWKIVEENFASDDWKERFAAGNILIKLLFKKNFGPPRLHFNTKSYSINFNIMQCHKLGL